MERVELYSTKTQRGREHHRPSVVSPNAVRSCGFDANRESEGPGSMGTPCVTLRTYIIDTQCSLSCKNS